MEIGAIRKYLELRLKKNIYGEFARDLGCAQRFQITGERKYSEMALPQIISDLSSRGG